MKTEILIGADPEVFLHDGMEFISAYGRFPGTKDEPYPVNKGAIQVDGMALEFNIHPAKTAEEFDSNISVVLNQMDEFILQVDPLLNKVFEPIAEFDPTYFEILPNECKILGCDPDFTSRGDRKIPDPNLQFRPFRTAAGHVHIGWRDGGEPLEEDHFERCKKVAAAFRNVEGFFPKTRNERERIKYYGQPGSFRPKSYGIELRSPSNIWVKNSDDRVKMFEIVQKTMRNL